MHSFVGFAYYAPGARNEWVVTYDEALIITRGAFTVTSADRVSGASFSSAPPGRA
jgi:hypothetical protein